MNEQPQQQSQTASRTRTPSRSARPLPLGARLCQLILLIASGVTIYLGTLSCYAGISYGLTADQRDRLYTDQSTIPDRQALQASRSEILTLWDAWLPYDDLAQVVLADAYDKGVTKPEGRKLMPEVLRLEAEALKRNPANAYAWSRLAFARYIYSGPSRLVAEPLVQSIQAAPYEPPLLASRVVLALRIEKYWTDALRDLFPQQLERAWLRESVDTVQAAYQNGIEDRLREKLAEDPVKLAQFDKILASIKPQ